VTEHASGPGRSLDGVPSTATDLRYGRRGGGWLPAGYDPLTVRSCPVCAGALTVGQDMHQECVPLVLTLFDPDE
jgi:hypothetical protein